MADFKLFYPTLHRNEGKYAHNLKDKGGETYRGIARNSHPNAKIWPYVKQAKEALGLVSPVTKIKDWKAINRYLDTFEDAAELNLLVVNFYKILYWNSLQLDFLNTQPLAEQLADHGVNAGIKRPAYMIQYLLVNEFRQKLLIDGDIGTMTVSAINSVNQQMLYARFVAMRKAFYRYRADMYDVSTPQKVAALSKWHKFFYDTLKLRKDAGQRGFLPVWLSRCTPDTIGL